MSYPPLSRSVDKPALTRRDELPPGTAMEPRRTEAELLYMDRTWRPVTVLGWLRLDVAHRQPLTNRWVFWLIQLQLAGREEGWFEYDSLNVRPRSGR